MDIDFTNKKTGTILSEQNKDPSDSSSNLEKKFYLLENDIFYNKVGNGFDDPFEKADCLFEVKEYIANIKEAIKWSKEQPYDKCIKILNFILAKCNKDIQQYCKEFKATQNYEPSQSEVEKYMENPYVEDFDDSLYERLMEEGYYKAIEAYEKTHEKELEGLSTLQGVAHNIEKEIYTQEVKQKFIKEALTYQEKDKNTIPNLLNFIIAPDKERIKLILKKVLANKKGKQVALYIIALEKIKYIEISTRSSFYEAIRKLFKYDIGSDQSINKYLIKSAKRFQDRQEYAFFPDDEIKKAIENITFKY